MKGKHLYILSGLGADHRVFQKISFPIPHTFLPWKAEFPNESLSSYAKRMAQEIKHQDPIILGLSFGGIVAHEISRFMKVKHLVLMSTVSCSDELPFYYKWAGAIKLPSLLPAFMLRNSNPILNYMFSMQKVQEKRLLEQIMSETRVQHFRWALDRISHWRATQPTTSFSRIHGESDRIFPTRFLSSTYIKVKGGHFCVYGEHEEVQEKLDEILGFGKRLSD